MDFGCAVRVADWHRDFAWLAIVTTGGMARGWQKGAHLNV